MDSQKNHSESGDTRQAFNNARVVIVDPAPTEAAAKIAEIVASCGATPCRVSVGSLLEGRCDGCAIAIVAVAIPPSARAAVLDDVRHLKQTGYTVLCSAAGASEWPLGVRCRLLLAGAAEVFDSRTADFAGSLRGYFESLLRAAADAEYERDRVHALMSGLGVVGSSGVMTAMFRSLARVSAVSDLPVLITGETGTGKELAARAIHDLDRRRRDRPFVAVNCGAISAGLAESDLFGHRRGAFTGADHERAGLFRAARGGVLFLDEIGDLELALQAKLLRVLQERRVLAVGEDHEVPVDVRVIAATNRDLEEMVRRHAFRADLLHRLNVLAVHVPALRDRPEDIGALVRHFASRCSGDTRVSGVVVSGEFVEALRRVDLPGNVRQLENIVRRAVATAERDGQLRLRDLPPELWVELAGDEEPPGAATRGTDGAGPLDPVAILEQAAWNLDDALARCEQQFVAAALGASRGNRSRAARLLGISPRCIFNKMRKHRFTA